MKNLKIFKNIYLFKKTKLINQANVFLISIFAQIANAASLELLGFGDEKILKIPF